MKRRDFFKLAASSGIVVSANACRKAVPDAPLAALGVNSVEEYVQRIDEALYYIENEAELSDELLAAGSNIARSSGEPPQYVKRFDELFRKMMRTTVMTGMFGDLPPHLQQHPAIQERMWQFVPEMDETITELGYILESLDETQREELRNALVAAPNLGPALAQEIDRHARKIGVSVQRRAQFNEMVEQIAWKMKEQSPSLLINDYQTKTQKAYERHGATEQFHRAVISRLGEDAFWAHQENMAKIASMYGHTSVGPEDDGIRTKGPSRSYRRDKARATLKTSAWILGISAAATGVGWILIATGVEALIVPGVIFGVTLGPIGLVIGLLGLLVAGIQFAAAK